MLILDLKEIFQTYDVFEKSYVINPEELKFPADLGEIKEPVKVHVKIEKDDRGYLFTLKISGGIELECSRCLEIFRKEISEERKKHVEAYPQEEVLELSENDLDVSFMEEKDVVDLVDLVREELILSVPMKPLCSPNCTGIHHHAFIFEEEKEEKKDPRFAILKKLLTK